MSDNAISAGCYKGHAIAGSAQYGITRNGTDQIVIDVLLSDLRRTLSIVLFFSEKAAPYSLEKLRACGWQGDDVANLIGIDANEILVSVAYETYEGKERMKTDILTGGGRITLDSPMDAAAKRGFAARMKASAKSVPATSAAPKPPPAARSIQPEVAEDDDLPF